MTARPERAAACRWVCEHLDSYVDGELDTSLVVEFDRHLAGCEPCDERLRFERAFRGHVRSACATPPCPERLRARVRGALAEAELQRSGVFGVPRAAAGSGLGVPAAAASILAVAGVAAIAFMPDGETAVAAEQPKEHTVSLPEAVEDVIAVHRRALPVDAPAEKQGDFLRPRLSFHASPVQLPRARLEGARLLRLQGQDAPAYFYDRGGRRVTVVVLSRPTDPGPGGELPAVETRRVGDRPVRVVRVRGHEVPVIEHGGLAYVIAGDLDSGELMRLAADARVP